MPHFLLAQSSAQAYMPHSPSVQSLLHWWQEPHTLGLFALLHILDLSVAVGKTLMQI